MRLSLLVFWAIGWGLCIATFIITMRVLKINQRLKLALQASRDELRETLQQQQGMTFKFKKSSGHFIHTFCAGKLVYKLGCTPSIVVGKTLHEFMTDEEETSRKEAYYERAWNGENVTYQGRMNGVWYVASLRPICRSGEVTEVIASCVDITEQKLAESALRQSESMYRLIAESSTDTIRILTPDMTIQYASPSHKQILGYCPEELVGTPCFLLVAHEDQERVVREFKDMIRQKSDHYQVYFPAKHKNGRIIMFETHGRLVLSERGDVISVIVVSRDLTKRIKSEKDIRKADKLTLAGQLAAGIAHEIRNPMTTIKGFVQLLRNPTEKQVFYTDVVLTELKRVESIIDEFLLLAKPEVSNFEIHDLRTLLHDVTTLLDSQAILDNVQLQSDFGADTISVLAVSSQLKQVFINIIKNALEAMPTGGNVYIATMKHELTVEVSIADEGCGIPHDRIPQLGEPFYTTKEKGTGLGLMVSYKIVKDHGGHIVVHSVMGRGTSVQVILPLHPEQIHAEHKGDRR